MNNQIITNGDVENEIKYLELLNPSIKKMQKKELFFLSKNSLIREKIKEIEIKKYYNLDNNYPFVNKLVDRFIDPINWWADNTDRDWVPIARTAINGIDTRDRLWDVIDDLEKSSIDFYAAMRSLYRQRRNKDISNGANSNDNQTKATSNIDN